MSVPSDLHHVLWTGGWDSTFRVADLLLVHGRHVQPWYVVDPERRTTDRELAAMSAIRSALVARDRSIADRLRPTIVRDVADLAVLPAIADAARSVRARGVPLPEQYLWLATLAFANGDLGLELGIDERTDTDSLIGVAVEFSAGAPPDDWAYVTSTGNPADIVQIYGGFRLPVSELTKADMERRALDAGFADVLELTWFCRWPTILGNPCGQCVPCQGTRTGGLPRRVPPDSPLRRRLHVWRWDWVRRGASARIRARAARDRLRT